MVCGVTTEAVTRAVGVGRRPGHAHGSVGGQVIGNPPRKSAIAVRVATDQRVLDFFFEKMSSKTQTILNNVFSTDVLRIVLQILKPIIELPLV